MLISNIECFYFNAKNTYYRPQTKLREGNVFPGVCLSMGWGVGFPACITGHKTSMGLPAGGSACRGSASRGSLPQGGSACRRVCLRGCVSRRGCASNRRVCIHGGVCLKRVLPQGGSACRGICLHRGSASGGMGRPPRTRKAGSTYPTGMLSCFSIYLQIHPLIFNLDKIEI